MPLDAFRAVDDMETVEIGKGDHRNHSLLQVSLLFQSGNATRIVIIITYKQPDERILDISRLNRQIFDAMEFWKCSWP